MKKKYIYICSFFIMVALFTWAYGESFQHAKKEYEASEKVDTVQELRVTNHIAYYEEVCVLGKDNVTREKCDVPADIAGKTKEQLENHYRNISVHPSLEDSLKGLIGYEIVSFSNQKLVVRRTYEDMSKANRYFVTLKNNQVVVYYSDKKSVFEYTGIDASRLPEGEQGRLKIGYYVKTEQEIYSILENYSS